MNAPTRTFKLTDTMGNGFRLVASQEGVLARFRLVDNRNRRHNMRTLDIGFNGMPWTLPTMWNDADFERRVVRCISKASVFNVA